MNTSSKVTSTSSLIATGRAIRLKNGKVRHLCDLCKQFQKSGVNGRCTSRMCRNRVRVMSVSTVKDDEAFMCLTCRKWDEFDRMMGCMDDPAHDSFAVLYLSDCPIIAEQYGMG